jgi:hypothetical protein
VIPLKYFCISGGAMTTNGYGRAEAPCITLRNRTPQNSVLVIPPRIRQHAPRSWSRNLKCSRRKPETA